MSDTDDLFEALDIPVHDDPELGRFILHPFGSWQLSCTVDFPFQADVDMIFELAVKTETLPDSMPRNVAWIQANLTEIWNAAALAINNMVEAQQIEMTDEFAVDSMQVELPDASVEATPWKLIIEPSYLQTSFEVTFKGLSVNDQRCIH